MSPIRAAVPISFGECLAVHTKNLADGPTHVRATPLPRNPTTPRDSYVVHVVVVVQIRAGEGSVRHVEVFQVGSVRTSIVGDA